MEIKDKEALRQLKIVKSYELEDMVVNYPEDEREGQTDLQILYGEVDYLLDKYESDETVQNAELKEARRILRQIRNGTPCEFNFRTGQLTPIYSNVRIQEARDRVNEYNRIVNLRKRLRAMGIR